MRLKSIQTLEKAIIFGLYSGAYLNGHKYLRLYQAFELQMMLDNYNSRMAELDAEGQRLLLDLVAKRYISDIEGLIHARELDTRRADIAVTDGEWDAKFQALETDRAAIETMKSRLLAEERKIASRIQTLEAEILIEGVELQLQALDVAQKRLAAVKAEADLARKEINIKEAEIALIKKDIELQRLDIDWALERLSPVFDKEFFLITFENDTCKINYYILISCSFMSLINNYTSIFI
jgi:hypothetical protein